MARKITVRLSDEAGAGYDRLARTSGGTMSALFEAVGLALRDGSMKMPEVVLEKARAIDVERRNRR